MRDVNNPQSLDVLPNVPPRPGVKNLDEFLSLSPEQQWSAISAWRGFWLKPTPAVDVPSGSRIILHEPPAKIETENWKQAPTPEERKSLADWNKS